MLEGLATWILNTYLGQYLENLNTDQLSIGLLNGKVELENVPLRKDALRHLDMALQVRAGFVGKVRLQIPVARLRSEPWIIIFEDLYLVAGPINLTEYDEDAEIENAHSRKISQLDAIEAAWLSEQEAMGEETLYGSSYASWISYGTSFITHIIENIQLKIKDVHLRYEDDQCNPPNITAFGITVDSLSVQSSDEHWIPKFILPSNCNMSYKLLELKNLGLYVDESSTTYGDKSVNELTELMSICGSKKQMNYILEPVSSTACLKRNLSSNPLRSRSLPRFTCDLKLENFNLTLSDKQYGNIISSLRYYDRLETARPYRKWRPKCDKIIGNCASWWRYAIQCHLEKIKKKYAGRNWAYALYRVKTIRKYIEVYSSYLKNPGGIAMEVKQEKMKIETEFGFEELRYLRNFAMEKINNEKVHLNGKENGEKSETASTEGVLQRWFPLWGGWYTSNEATIDSLTENESLELKDGNDKGIILKQTESGRTTLEEELLYVLTDSIENNSFIKRDAVFCQLSFTLKQGSISLTKTDVSQPLFVLEFFNVKMALESRPRHQSFTFDVELGSVSLKDQVTERTTFPLLICQQRDPTGASQKMGLLRGSGVYAKLSSMISSVSRISQAQAPVQGPLFSLRYERKPKNSKFDSKLVITSQSLDIVYNKAAFNAIQEFFYPKLLADESFPWTYSAQKKYERLKQQTRDEIKKNWNNMIQSLVNSERRKWDIQLDISAPQIIIPEHFQDLNATIVILDFGKLNFSSAQSDTSEKMSPSDTLTISEDDDAFATPFSTPDEFIGYEESSDKVEYGQGAPIVTPNNLHQHLYDKYDLKLCDLQVLVARVRDNWKFAYQKGTGSMHLVDRFNINIHLEKRVFDIIPDQSSVNEWPNVTLSGSLPQLVIHINDQKIHAIRNVASFVFPKSNVSSLRPKSDFVGTTSPQSGSRSTLNVDSTEDIEETISLIVMQFSVDKLSLELQSRGRSIAELQVTGVKAQFCKRPTDSSALLSVHSLLLVDALQTFGPDFELLIASHKHISMDSVSGSLLDSEPCSPTSPASPDPNIPGRSTSPVALSQALSSLAVNRAYSPFSDNANAQSPPVLSPTFGPSFVDARDTEALITWELTYIDANADSSESGAHVISSVQFNSLDVIANQETTVELVGFIHQITSLLMTPLSRNSSTTGISVPVDDVIHENKIKYDKGQDIEDGAKSSFYGSIASLYPPDEGDQKPPISVQTSFDFHKLTILLLRGAVKDKETIGRKVSTAVLSGAKIEVNVESGILTAEGSLGGFQIRDVTPESNKHQCIFSVGHDPIVEKYQALVSRLNMDIYQSVMEQQHKEMTKAFSFKVIRPLLLSSNTKMSEPLEDDKLNNKNKLNISLHLASVCYTHSPLFLAELKSCATEFKQYMTQLALRIKQAATDMAIGLVSKRIESFASLSTTNWDPNLKYKKYHSLSRSFDNFSFPKPPPTSIKDSAALSPIHSLAPDLSFNLLLDVVLETPVIVLPENPNSANVLVAHLGQISLKNCQTEDNDPVCSDINPVLITRLTQFQISIKDMNLYSLNIEERLRSRDMNFNPLTTTMMCAEELYSCKDHGSPIVHSTSIELHLTQKREISSDVLFSDIYPSDIFFEFGSTSTDSFLITGGVVTPIQVSVSRTQYHLMLQTFSNMSLPSLSVNGAYSDGLAPIPENEKPIAFHKESASHNVQSHQPLKAEFSVPSLCVELKGDVGNEKKPLANLLLEEISATYEICNPFESTTKISLQSLVLEDLSLSESDRSHRFLMKSETSKPTAHYNTKGIPIPGRKPKVDFLSTSCPTFGDANLPVFFPSSLPSKIELEKPFAQSNSKRDEFRFRGSMLKGIKEVPTWKKFSTTLMEENSAVNSNSTLVNITIYNIEEESVNFHSKYDGNHRLIDVDFNSLVTVVNLESWVMLLDFFKKSNVQTNARTPLIDKTQFDKGVKERPPEKNVVMEVKVRSFDLVLNKNEGELGCASINQVFVRSVGSEDTLTLNGSLGSLSLSDRTSYGTLYPEKFLTTGSEAMTFQLSKYSSPDPKLLRDCDIRLNFKMSSIMYVHSQRFAMEVTNFVQQFFLLRDMLSDFRAESAGLKVSRMAHGTRISLEISAGSPVIFIPMSCKSTDLLIGDLGSLSLTNKFLWAGGNGTISQVRREDLFDRLSGSGTSRSPGSSRSRSRSDSRRRILREFDKVEKVSATSKGPTCLLDVMHVSLVNMDLFTGQRIALDPFKVELPKRGLISPSKTKYSASKDSVMGKFLSYKIERRGGPLLKEKCAFKLQIEKNLDGHFSKIVPDYSVHGELSKIHATINLHTYMLIRGLLAHNLGEPLPEFSSPAFIFHRDTEIREKQGLGQTHIWTTLNIDIDLDNVTVDGEIPWEKDQEIVSLASINFIKSRLTYESYSDSSKDVDLVSQEILISDMRFKNCPANKRSNLFTSILQPAQDLCSKNENPLQAEVHYRSTKDVTRFTILLNKMRLMAIFDWWKAAEEFIQSSFPDPLWKEKQSLQIKKKEQEINLVNEFSFSKNSKSSLRLNPMVESTGLMTKHDLIIDQFQPAFEFKLNITDSEVIFVENSDVWDTAALILKTTAVYTYRPHFQERPVSCNLNQCELYSCILGLEEETALSIIDPVTVNVEVHEQRLKTVPEHAMDVSLDLQHTLEISLRQLNIRLSYHDMKMFQRILESFPHPHQQTAVIEPDLCTPANIKAQIEKLSGLGFLRDDCQNALNECKGQLDEAALWLTQNCKPVQEIPVEEQISHQPQKTINLSNMEVKTGSINLCIIDDCGDCDVPLLEVCLSHFGLKQSSQWKGLCNCIFSIDYFNRAMSGWEPFIEPWQCNLEWRKDKARLGDVEKIKISLATEETLNLTLTSTFVELCHLVKDNWTEDYYNRERQDDGGLSVSTVKSHDKVSTGSPHNHRRRIPFIPFALRNDTGCDLSFAPVTDCDSVDDPNALLESIQTSNLIRVESGCSASFSFEGKGGKQRHGNTHNTKSRQIIVRIDGWSTVGPITIDRVGVFFRLSKCKSQTSRELPDARIVFHITMDGLARKLITVRSALLLTNKLPYTVEIKLENVFIGLGAVRMIQIVPRATVPVPLLFIWSQIFVKPLFTSRQEEKDPRTSWIFCREPIQWEKLSHPHDELAELKSCDSVHTRKAPYRMCVYVLRDNYPEDVVILPSNNDPWEMVDRLPLTQPAHSIFLVSPLKLVNLLPFDLHYNVISTNENGRIRSGQNSFISSVDPENEVELSFWIDNFHSTSNLVIHASSSPITIPFKLQDNKERILYLQIQIYKIYTKALKVTISGFFWLINKTGLPLIFKQEGTSEAAGQDEEHELARFASPLLFSFSDPEASPMLLIRVGKHLHTACQPHYCKKFPLTQGTLVRRLLVSPNDHRPDFVYVIGIDVRPGRGRYRDTYMVTLSPRYHIDNRSSHELLLSQKCFTSSFVETGAQSTWLRAMPGCWLPFHWPRHDKDPLLCVLLCDVDGSYWSGGFLVEKAHSFNLNIRNHKDHCFFLRVEIVVSDATLFIIFSDADNLPPPFRIDNFSEVSITFYQTGIKEERLRSVVRAHSCVPYAWDEITLPPHITCIAPGGTTATYSLNVIGEGSRLTYENFIYISFTGTFRKESAGSDLGQHNSSESYFDRSSLEYLQLVLDVTEGSRVRLNRKELGRRSQLWRMTSTGMLQHEGSSPPYDPSSKKPRTMTNILVLDIAGAAPLPNEYTPLMLRKPDKRRQLTQTWRFTEDGRLCCQHANLYVQAKDGFFGVTGGSFGKWQLWNDVVLGPSQLVHYGTMDNGVPIEQAVSRQRLRPGSGQLSIRVATDGPTRVLQITDAHSKSCLQAAKTESGDLVYLNESGSILASALSLTTVRDGAGDKQITKEREIEIVIVLQGGLGISIVRPPEELVYTFLSDIVLQLLSSSHQQTIDCSIKDIQVDNQLPNNQCPVVLYVTPQSKTDETRHLPAIQLSLHHMRSPHQNAFIFKHLIITIKNLTLTIEEDLLYKLIAITGFDRSDSELEKVEESQYEIRKLLAAATSANATRFYFTHLKFVLNQVRLSVLKAKTLATELRKIRRHMGFTLVQFENALVSLDPFVRFHPFDTWRFLVNSMKAHYESELRSQAMRILGSTDFLGNPFGLFADVSEGVQELVKEGNVGGLVLNVTHGMANSTAKVTGSLSDAVGKATWDSKYEETRQRILSRQFGSTSDHFVSGLMGFGLGLYGGFTSIVSQTYVGASQKGLPGLFSGFAKGVVGTVTKPAIGFLDLATGTASAVRDTSKNPSLKLPSKIRKPRLVPGKGLIPRFSLKHAAGLELLRHFDSTALEVFVGYEILLKGEDDLRILISSEQILVFSWTDPKESPTAVLVIRFSDLYQCRPIKHGWENDSENIRYYLELTMKVEKLEPHGSSTTPSQLLAKRPKIRCGSFETASEVAQQINYARNLHNELKHTVPTSDDFYQDSS